MSESQRYEKLHPAFTFPSTSFAVFKSIPDFVLTDTATSNCTSQPASDFDSVATSSAKSWNSPGDRETRADNFRPGVSVGGGGWGVEALTANSTFPSVATDTSGPLPLARASRPRPIASLSVLMK